MKTAIIGGGASGMMCAALLLENGVDTFTVYEKNSKCGRKLAITGKGRCNLTNACEDNAFFQNVPTNPKFLYSSYYGFTSRDTMAFFEDRGVPLKIERGNRVFPVSDRSYDIVDALYFPVKNHVKNATVKSVLRCGDGFKVITEAGEDLFDNVVVATGGLSYPLTGSTGDGYRFARQLGINVTKLSPSLVPLISDEAEDCASAMGLTLKNVAVKLTSKDRKKLFSGQGEVLFTHFGISGPLVLSASANVSDSDMPCIFSIDLKPALDANQIDKKLVQILSENPNKDICNSLGTMLPSNIIAYYLKKCGIDPHVKCCGITKKARSQMTSVIKDFSIPVRAKSGFSSAVITRGGVDVAELDPQTMESKKNPGLYFAGEVIDVDAYTGGFNLQIAFSTASACAKAIAEKETKKQPRG